MTFFDSLIFGAIGLGALLLACSYLVTGRPAVWETFFLCWCGGIR